MNKLTFYFSVKTLIVIRFLTDKASCLGFGFIVKYLLYYDNMTLRLVCKGMKGKSKLAVAIPRLGSTVPWNSHLPLTGVPAPCYCPR